MPAAKTQAELLHLTQAEFDKLAAQLDLVARDDQMQPLDETGVTLKDIVGHRAHWIDLFFGWVEKGRAGIPFGMPADGFKWNQLPAYNAGVRALQAELRWEDVRAMLAANHARLMAFIEAEPDLYDVGLPGASNAWRLGRWAEAAGASHYRSATKVVRKALRESGLAKS